MSSPPGLSGSSPHEPPPPPLPAPAPAPSSAFADASVLVVGAGGIGNPAALALWSAGVGRLLVADDDEVEASNLHRQILYTEADIGQPKTAAFARRLLERPAPPAPSEPPRRQVETMGRALPETLFAALASVDVVLDGTDNFATRFLLADGCHLAARPVPVIHAAAVRWTGTVTVVAADGLPCYRCFFEDLPTGNAPDCATAGVVGPLCGVVGGLAANEVLRILVGDRTGLGSIIRFDARHARFRRTTFAPRRDCPLCGATPTIHSLDRNRYTAPREASCSAPLHLPVFIRLF
jgi:molybdopterin/thiamine biosynthesis adenylyltransferase